jgi:hypothetical protein
MENATFHTYRLKMKRCISRGRVEKSRTPYPEAPDETDSTGFVGFVGLLSRGSPFRLVRKAIAELGRGGLLTYTVQGRIMPSLAWEKERQRMKTASKE